MSKQNILRKTSILLFMFLLNSSLWAQERGEEQKIFDFNDCPTVGELNEVHFGGSNKIEIYRDYFPHENFTSPEWIRGRQEIYPVAYKAGTYPAVKAIFQITCPYILSDNDAKIYAKGICNNGFEFPSQLLGRNGQQATYLLKDANMPFKAATVDYFEEFPIKWYISIDQKEWKEAGESVNRLYVPLYIQNFNSCNNKFIQNHSVFYYACQPAKGKMSHSEILTNIWEQFKTTKMPRIDKPKLKEMLYWGGKNPLACRWTEELFNQEDANCGEWSGFFSATLNLHGIENCTGTITVPQKIDQNDIDMFLLDYEKTFETIAPKTIFNVFTRKYTQVVPYFFVKNWDFPDKYKFYINNSRYPYLSPKRNSFITKGNVTIKSGDLVGARAQGMDDPHSLFQDHATICIDGS